VQQRKVVLRTVEEDKRQIWRSLYERLFGKRDECFLLKLAIDHLAEIATLDNDTQLAQQMSELSKEVTDRIQKHAWKENFFARVLINRYKDGSYTYLGAKGDKLSADPNIDGVYFLNSFAWSCCQMLQPMSK